MDNPEPSRVACLVDQPECEPFPISRFVHFGDFCYYYAYGNTPAEDFLENAMADAKEPLVLSLGCGDLRSCLYTLWKYFSPEHGDRRFNGVHFVLNDFSAAVLARNILFLHLCMQMPSGKGDAKQWVAAIWGIWYSHELKPKHAHVLNESLKDLLKFSANPQSWSESLDNPLRSLVKFASTVVLHELHRIWKMWYERDVNVSSVSDMHRARLEQVRKKFQGHATPLLVDEAIESTLGTHIRNHTSARRMKFMEKEVESYFETGCCFAETVLNLPDSSGDTSFNVTLYERADGKYNFHYASVPYKCFFHAFEFSPVAASTTEIVAATRKKFLVGDTAFKGHPLLANSVQQFATWLMSSARILKQSSSPQDLKISFCFECSDAITFCQKLQQHPHVYASRTCTPTDHGFDLIYSSNLLDHLSPPNLVLAASPLLSKDGLLFTTSFLYKTIESTGEKYLQKCFGFDPKLLPVLCGTRCIGMEGEYADTVAVNPVPVESRNFSQVSRWAKLFIWQRVQMSPLGIRDLSQNATLIAALESSTFRTLTTLFQDFTGLQTTRHFSTETVIALLLGFISNVEDSVDITSSSFWHPLCSRLCKLTYLKPFLFQLQIQAFLHGLHLHLTVTESVCPICNNIPLTGFYQLSVKLSLPQPATTPVYIVCLHKSSCIDIEFVQSSVASGSMSGSETAYLELMSNLGEDVLLIDCIAGSELEGKLQLDFFLPKHLVNESYHFTVIAFQMMKIGRKDVNYPIKVEAGELADIQRSQVSYAFQQVSGVRREHACTSSFGQLTQHCGDGNHFESVIAFSSVVGSSLDKHKLSTQLVSESELKITCDDHSISLRYPYPVAYKQVAIKLSRQTCNVTVLAPRKAHCFHRERPLFLASPDIQASLPPIKLPKEVYIGLAGMQFTRKDRQLRSQSSNGQQVLPALLNLKVTFNCLFQRSGDHFFSLSVSDNQVGFLVVHNWVFDLHRKTPAIDLSYCFPSLESLQFYYDLRQFFPESMTDFLLDEAEFGLLKKVFAYFALRTIPSPSMSLGRMGLLMKHNVSHCFTRAVIYPLYADPDIWASDMKLAEAFSSSLPSDSCEKQDSSLNKHGKVCTFCQKCSSDLKACTNCCKAHYCSKECQAKDWSMHKRICNWKREKTNATDESSQRQCPQDGRPNPPQVTEHSLTQPQSQEPLTPNEYGNPPAGYTTGSNDTTVCSYCHNVSDKMKTCQGCSIARYCNKDCQKSHWRVHKSLCRPKSIQPKAAKADTKASIKKGEQDSLSQPKTTGADTKATTEQGNQDSSKATGTDTKASTEQGKHRSSSQPNATGIDIKVSTEQENQDFSSPSKATEADTKASTEQGKQDSSSQPKAIGTDTKASAKQEKQDSSSQPKATGTDTKASIDEGKQSSSFQPKATGIDTKASTEQENQGSSQPKATGIDTKASAEQEKQDSSSQPNATVTDTKASTEQGKQGSSSEPKATGTDTKASTEQGKHSSSSEPKATGTDTKASTEQGKQGSSSQPKSTGAEPFSISRFVHFGDFRYYYAYGNTPAEDFLENAMADESEPLVLSLGCGDLRSCLYTLWKYFSPEHGDRRFNGVHFVLNDYSAAVLARNILFLHLCMQMPSGKGDAKQWVAAIWGIWYSHELKPKHAQVLNESLKDLLKFSTNPQSWSESLDNPLCCLVKFASTVVLHELHRIWKMWYERDVNVSSVSDMHRARLEQVRKKCHNHTTQTLVNEALESTLGTHIRRSTPAQRMQSMEREVENYINTGCCFAETVLNLPQSSGKTSLNITLYERADGKYNFHYASLPYKCFSHAFEFSPVAASKTEIVAATRKQFLVRDTAFEGHPLLANSVQLFATWLTSSARILKQASSTGETKISFCFERSDAITFCQKLQQYPHVYASRTCTPIDHGFDLIYSSNLLDHVSPPNLVLAATPLLSKDGLLFTTSFLYKTIESTGEQYLQKCFGFDLKLLPVLCGVRCIGMEGEYADTVAVNPEPVESRNFTQVAQWAKVFIWQRVQMSPLGIRDLSQNATLIAALESSVFRTLTTLFQDFTGLRTTRHFCTETVIALLLGFISNVGDLVDITSSSFWRPLCSRLCKLRYLKPFLFQLQIQAFLHGLHLHLTVTESVCPLCSNTSLHGFLHQFSVKLSLPQKAETPLYLVCLHKSSPIDIEYLANFSLSMLRSVKDVKEAYLEVMSSLGEDVHLIDCIAGNEVEGKLQLDFFLPHSLVTERYRFTVIVYPMLHIAQKGVNYPMKIMEGELADIQRSRVSYAFQHVSSVSREHSCTSSFGQLTQHCGDGDYFESVIAFSSAVESSLENHKLSTQLLSETELAITCDNHSISLRYPYPVAYKQVAIKLSRRKCSVTVSAPRKAHCFHRERPLFIASPDIQASLPPLQLTQEVYLNLTGIQFTNEERQIKRQANNDQRLLPALLKLKETFCYFFQCRDKYFHLKISGRLVGIILVHNRVFDLHRRTPAIDLSFCLCLSNVISPHIFIQLAPAEIRIISIDEEEFGLLKEVFAYFALRTIPSPSMCLGRMGLLMKLNISQYFTRAVIYPLYGDPDKWVHDMNLAEAFSSSISLDSCEKPDGLACTCCQKFSIHLKACSYCDKAHYCSKECQAKDWSMHKETCNWKREKTNATDESSQRQCPQDGRPNPPQVTEHSLTQPQSQEPLTPNKYGNPPAGYTTGSNDTTVCSYCHKVSDMMKTCQGCSIAHYCNRNCQKSHWKIHKSLCQPKSIQPKPTGADTKASTEQGKQDSSYRPKAQGAEIKASTEQRKRDPLSRPNATGADPKAETEQGKQESCSQPKAGAPITSGRKSSHLDDTKSEAQSDSIICSFCGKPSTSLKACNSCKWAQYCNKDCQTRHWREHKQICLQYKETGSLKAVTPTSAQHHIVADCCSGCNKSSWSLRNCRCHLAAYCSVECQRNDWPRHVDECTARSTRK